MMPLLSRGERSVREKVHARDPRLEAGDSSRAVLLRLLDRLHDEADFLILTKGQVARWLQNAGRMNGINLQDHVSSPHQDRSGRI